MKNSKTHFIFILGPKLQLIFYNIEYLENALKKTRKIRKRMVDYKWLHDAKLHYYNQRKH
jgi:hypothetical protein